MNKKNSLSRVQRVQKVYWKDVRDEVKEINPEIAQHIDLIDPGKDFPLLKARYYFGDRIVNNGVWYLPLEDGSLVTPNDSRIGKDIKKMFEYRRLVPIGIVLNNSTELYFNAHGEIVPWRMVMPGRIFALWGSLQPTSTTSHATKAFCISAGARSLIMAPKISDSAFYKRIQREFDLKSLAPKMISDQWNTFVELAQHPDFPESWYVDVLFFSGNWLEERNDLNWTKFELFLYKTAWLDSSYLRDQNSFDGAFSFALKYKNLKPNPYLADTVKHLHLIGRGAYPGFIVAGDNRAAPLSGFQDIFANLYDLKYAPTMLHLWPYTPGSKCPSYYSLGLPVLVDFSPKAKQSASKFEDLREVKHIMDRLLTYILESQDEWGLKNTPIYNWAQHTQYDYFHTEKHRYRGNIQLTNKLPDGDPVLQKDLKRYPNKPFCDTSPFFRGCIRISFKNIL